MVECLEGDVPGPFDGCSSQALARPFVSPPPRVGPYKSLLKHKSIAAHQHLHLRYSPYADVLGKTCLAQLQACVELNGAICGKTSNAVLRPRTAYHHPTALSNCKYGTAFAHKSVYIPEGLLLLLSRVGKRFSEKSVRRRDVTRNT